MSLRNQFSGIALSVVAISAVARVSVTLRLRVCVFVHIRV